MGTHWGRSSAGGAPHGQQMEQWSPALCFQGRPLSRAHGSLFLPPAQPQACPSDSGLRMQRSPRDTSSRDGQGEQFSPRGPCPGPSQALEAEMQSWVGQTDAPSDVHTALRCCVPAEGARTFHYYTTSSDWLLQGCPKVSPVHPVPTFFPTDPARETPLFDTVGKAGLCACGLWWPCVALHGDCSVARDRNIVTWNFGG